MKALIARASVGIAAPRHAVWRALVDPASIMQIMPVTEVVAPWRAGQRFEWVFELAGKRSRVAGFVHRMEDGRLIEYEYTDPHSRDVLGTDHIHRVTIELSKADGATRVTVVQDANLSHAAHAHAEGGWRLALNHLRGLVESTYRTQEP